jgi:tetratricopeptide (TPR) repeat protein
MHNTNRIAARPDRVTNRLIFVFALVLAIGIPLIGVLYVLDQFHPAGPSLIDRDIAVAEEAVTSDPNLLSARLGLAQAYAKAGRFADAVAQYDQILNVEPDAGGALLGRGSARIELDQLDAAKTDFQRVVDLARGGEMARYDPQLESAYFSLGTIALRQGDPKEATVALADAININRTDADALNLLGTALLQAGEPERAVTATRQAIALVPVGWCEPYAQLERAYTALRDTAGAQYAAGMGAFCEGRPEAARTALLRLVDGAYAADALVGLGLLAEQENDTAGARAAYTKVLATDPQNFAATTGLGRVGGPAASGGPARAPSAAPSSAPAAAPAGGN